MTTLSEVEAEQVVSGATKVWWLFLITGIAWVLISFVILGFDPTSASTIGYLTGAMLIVAGVNEFFTMSLVAGWRWLHGVLGVLFVIAGIGAFMSPFQTFGILALLIGWYLVFKGIFDMVVSLAERHVMDLWGLLLASGIAQIVLGVWALGYPGRSAWLLVLWVGLGALMRGITEIILAFGLRHVGRAA